jgi:hypothetical protein
MPRVCTICTHPERTAIEQALVANEPFRNIAERFGTSATALTRHKVDHLPGVLVQATKAQETADALDVMTELRRCFDRINLLFDACDRWLRDPDNPDEYTLEPRANEVKVIYTEPGPLGKPVQKKARLSLLLDRLQGKTVLYSEIKHADPRELVLKTAAQLESQQELLAKLIGQLQQEGTTNITISAEWLEVRTVLVKALQPYPEARTAVAAALSEVEHAG